MFTAEYQLTSVQDSVVFRWSLNKGAVHDREWQEQTEQDYALWGELGLNVKTNCLQPAPSGIRENKLKLLPPEIISSLMEKIALANPSTTPPPPPPPPFR